MFLQQLLAELDDLEAADFFLLGVASGGEMEGLGDGFGLGKLKALWFGDSELEFFLGVAARVPVLIRRERLVSGGEAGET